MRDIPDHIVERAAKAHWDAFTDTEWAMVFTGKHPDGVKVCLDAMRKALIAIQQEEE